MKKLIFFLLFVGAGVWTYFWYVQGINLFSRTVPGAGVPSFSMAEQIPEETGLEVGQGHWRLAAPMPTRRIWASAATIEGRIYVVGGMDAFGRTLDTVEVYDPFRNSWITAAPLPLPLHHVGLIGKEGKLYAIGGLTGLSSQATERVFIYDPKTAQWTDGPAMPGSIGASALAATADGIHVFGGRSSFGSMSIHYYYDLMTEGWVPMEELTTVRDSMPAVIYDNQIWIIGGRAGSAVADLGIVERWNVANGGWADATNISTRRSDFAAVSLKNRIYLFGGEAATLVFKDVVAYDPITQKWLNVAQMPEPRHGFGTATFNDMVFLFGGGHRPGWSVSDLTQVYIP